MNRYINILIIAIGLVPATCFFAQLQTSFGQLESQAPTLELIVPDPEIQGLLDQLAPPKTEEGVKATLQRLRAIAGQRFEKLIPQLVLHRLQARNDGSENEIPLAGFIVRELEIQNGHIVTSVVPLLGSSDPALEKEIRKWLAMSEDLSQGRPPDFSTYYGILEDCFRNGKDLPRALIRYMYERDAGTALVTIMRAAMLKNLEDRKAIAWTEHQVADVMWKWDWGFLPKGEVHAEAREALAQLARHNQWWARLYVAEILLKYPAFRTDELMTAMLADEDETVRTIATQIVTSLPTTRPD